MKRFLALVSVVLSFATPTALVAGSIVINGQPVAAKHAVNHP